jgi:hypothetical protein
MELFQLFIFNLLVQNGFSITKEPVGPFCLENVLNPEGIYILMWASRDKNVVLKDRPCSPSTVTNG